MHNKKEPFDSNVVSVMRKRSKTTIIIGLLVFTATLAAALIIFIISAASGPEIMASPQRQVERYQAAQTILTTFLFVAALELIITGMLAYQWRKSGIPHQPPPDDHDENQKGARSKWVRFTVLTGVIAFATSYVAALLDVFVFDVYGGLSPNMLICTGTPAVLFGSLGGFIWGTVRRRSRLIPIDWVVLIIIGILAGVIPGACVKLLPQ